MNHNDQGPYIYIKVLEKKLREAEEKYGLLCKEVQEYAASIEKRNAPEYKHPLRIAMEKIVDNK